MANVNLSEIIDYYVNLLIKQYSGQPKATATISTLCKTLLSNELYWDIRDGFDLETAIGTQLDILGKYIGIDRNYTQIIVKLNTYFIFSQGSAISIPSYVGMGQQLSPGKIMDNTDVIASFRLNDDIYRRLLMLQLIINNSNLSEGSIDDALYKFFGQNILMFGGMDMTIVYFFSPDIGLLSSVTIQKNVLPKPIGVRVTFVIQNPNVPFFCLTQTLGNGNTYFAGMGQQLSPGKIMDNTDILWQS